MITDKNYVEAEKARRGILEINTEEYYFGKLRPFMKEVMAVCKTDPELYRTLDKVINETDGLCAAKEYPRIIEAFSVLNNAITDLNYFNGVMQKASEEEKKKVRELISKIADFFMIVKCEEPVEKPEKKTKDRLDYKKSFEDSPIGENMGYREHNMKKLNEPNPGKRIPNV